MYALALLLSAATTAATTGLPYLHLGAVEAGVPIQWFGMIVAAGVIIGAIPLRRYAEWHGVSDENIRSLLTWVMLSGFLGAHELDVIAYQWDRIGDATQVAPAHWWPGMLPDGLWPANWPLVLRFWDGISSYGGFIGGAIGYTLYVWWKRLPFRLFADITIVGLLPAFSIGRIGCTVVSDHIGSQVDGGAWYSFLAMDYPRKLNLAGLADTYPGTSEFIKAWNLGLIEFLYLVPVNAVILWLAFRPTKRTPAGFVCVLGGILYAPVRFGLDYLRPEGTDPRHLGLTFAQWASILAFGVAIYAATRILKAGKAADVVAPTSREAQAQLRMILREDVDAAKGREMEKQAEAERKKAEIARLRAERDAEDAEEAAKAKKEAEEAEQNAKADSQIAAADEAAAAKQAEKAEPATSKAATSKFSSNPAAKAGAPSAQKSGGGANKRKPPR